MDCKFCLTALGPGSSLTAGEIVGQVLRVAAEIDLESNADRMNIVMMGQGEPLAESGERYQSHTAAYRSRGWRSLRDESRLSTSGIIPKIVELAQEAVRPKLAISLERIERGSAPRAMPITRKVSSCRN